MRCWTLWVAEWVGGWVGWECVPAERRRVAPMSFRVASSWWVGGWETYCREHLGEAGVKAHLQRVHFLIHHYHGRVDGQTDDVLLAAAGYQL